MRAVVDLPQVALGDVGIHLRRGYVRVTEQLLDLGALIQVQREIARDRRGRLAKLWGRFDRRSVRKGLAALGRAAQPPPGPPGTPSADPA